MHSPNSSNKALTSIAIIALITIVIAVLVLFKPEAKKRKPPSGPSISVETISIESTDLKPSILSYGLVEPRTKSKVVAQVSGRIENVSERFRDGGFFKKGDLLLKIDATDYEIEVDVARANLADAERGLEEEKAQAKQAKEDWARLGEASAPSPLVLREPQLKAAEAKVSSVKALLKRANVNLARTQIHAPFDGRVLTTNIDLGQVASNNSVLGEIYATDAVEIRLPIKNNEIPLLNLPEAYSHQNRSNDNLPKVNIISDLAGSETWQGHIIRTASSIDASSRQLYVVARIDEPFGKKAEGRFPLKIGQYITAQIEGKVLESAISIPNKAIYQGAYVYTFSEGAVYRKPISIHWQNGEIAIIKDGLSIGEELVISPLGQIASGTEVKLANPKTLVTNSFASKGDQTKGPNTVDAQPISVWLSNVPAKRLERIKARAEKEGRTIEEVAEEMRARKAPRGPK